MPSVLPPKLRWRRTSLPLLEAGLDPIERAQRVIAGSLILWSSRTVGFNWADHPESEMAYRYCVARINGDREAPRPTVSQLRACLQEVVDQIDAESYRALNILALSMGSEVRAANPAAEQSTDFFGLDGERIHDLDEPVRPAKGYSPSGEPPHVEFSNSEQPDACTGARREEFRPAPVQSPRPPPPSVRPASTPPVALRAPEPRRVEVVDSMQDLHDARERRAMGENPPSMLDQVASSLRSIVRAKRDERNR